jgi:hypothetical protein
MMNSRPAFYARNRILSNRAPSWEAGRLKEADLKISSDVGGCVCAQPQFSRKGRPL